MTSRLQKLEPQGTSPINSATAKVSNRDLATTELPKISLMTFDGDRTCWVDFRETYKAAKSNIVKEKRAGCSSEVSANVTSTNKTFQCYLCNANHALRACSKFREVTVPQQQEQVRKSRVCYNSLGAGHFAAMCSSQKRCRYCQAKHNTLLHAGSVHESSDHRQPNICCGRWESSGRSSGQHDDFSPRYW